MQVASLSEEVESAAEWDLAEQFSFKELLFVARREAMAVDYSAHFRALVEAQLPEDARILMPRGGADLMILMTWRLHSDPLRPSKRSRMVRILIQEEALEDYAAGSAVARGASDARLVSWLWAQLGAFDPDHEAALGVEPPAVTWKVGRAELGG